MTQSFNVATFDDGNWSTGDIAGGTYTESAVTGLSTIHSVTFTGTLSDPNALTGASLTLNLADGSNSGLAVTDLTYVGFAPSTDTSGDPTFFVSGDVTGIGTVTFAITTDPSGPLNFSGSVTGVDTSAISAPSSTNPEPPCFVTGTLIATARGEVAVENLAVGDLVVTTVGVARPIMWVGNKRVRRPTAAHQPVRVMAGAFGDNLPVRDLMLSPGHAVCVDVMDAVFVPVGELINGATIAQVKVDEVTYWHVELESHDVLVAEGLPCESYMDAGNRAFFGREYGRLAQVDPERVAESLTRYARPFVNRGPLVEAIRERVAARAEALGWTQTSNKDLHLIVGGQRIEPTIDGDLARFVIPAETGEARLVSRTFVPGADRRKLGVRIKGLTVSDGLRLNREIPLDVLSDGVYGLEHEGQRPWRWTDGDALLPSSLWQGCNGLAILAVGFNPQIGRAWIAPEREPLRAVA
jgi:hypothetical protein